MLTAKFKLTLLTSLTNVKLVLVSSLAQPDCEKKLASVYEHYAIFLGSNAFYLVG